jgi:hypothetical protein
MENLAYLGTVEAISRRRTSGAAVACHEIPVSIEAKRECHHNEAGKA